MAKKETMEIAEIKGFEALAHLNSFNEALVEECQGMDFTFDRIKLPTGGGTAFEVPTIEDGESEMVKELVGVIVYNHPAYAYYANKYSGGSNPPDCGSFDGVDGVGTPGGKCAVCPYNRFGSGEGQSKLCKNKRMLYFLREGEFFPVMLSLPTGSLRSFMNYVKSNLSKGRRLNQVVTKITLKRATNLSGIAFSQAVFTFDRVLNDEERAAVGHVTEAAQMYAEKLNPAAMAEFHDDLPADSDTERPVPLR